MNTFTPSENPEIRELQQHLTQLKMDIESRLNALNARLLKIREEYKTKVAEQTAVIASLREELKTGQPDSSRLEELTAQLEGIAAEMDAMVDDPAEEPTPA
jgi:chromosome segregation ATPase